MLPIQRYIQKFRKLNVSRSNGVAPHKPILLLSVIQLIEQGEIRENKICITPELVAAFKSNWHGLVTSDHFTANFSLPFFHLKTDGFWHLQTYPGTAILLTSSASIKSFAALKNAVNYAWLEDELYQLLQNTTDRNLLRQVLLDTYFNAHSISGNSYDLLNKIELQILNEPSVEYQRVALKADEEETFIRSGVFKKVIPSIYDHTCCISGMRIISTRDVQMIDACHIVPFSESHDDTITNGISLSPNFHRAFDRHLITIDKQYRVVVSDSFAEAETHFIKHFHGKQIILPKEVKYYPSLENLGRHNDKFGALNL